MTQAPLITPVILSGGSGTRLWPLSTGERPKQFLNLLGPLSMFQLTLQRCAAPGIYRDPVLVGASGHAAIMQEQIEEVGATAGKIILEPCARNTAPAIALAALAAENPADLLLVMPSDHIIKNVKAFQKAVQESVSIAQSRWLVTFGIEPSGPATGYGYIQKGEPIIGTSRSLAVSRFVEKPNQGKAAQMLADGGHYWNAGIFLFRADSYLAAMADHAPGMLEACKAAIDGGRTEAGICHPDAEAFAAAPSDSIDYAIMERAKKIAVTPVSPGWSDVGSWDSLYEISDKDQNSNVLFGKVATMGSRNNLIHSHGLDIAVLGVENLIIVTHGDKIVILPRGQSQDVKTIAQMLDDQD